MMDGMRVHARLRSAVVVAVACLAALVALNITAVAALVHPMLGVAALLIMGAAALSVTHAVCEHLAPGALRALGVDGRSIVRYLRDGR